MVNNITLKRVNSFTHLRSKISNDGENTTDINCRIAQAMQAFLSKKTIIQIG